MKKYSVHSLYVVEVERGIDTYYLICKHNELSNFYIEIFTNEKIKVDNILSVDPLSNCFSLFERYNFKTKTSLMLDKKQLLKEYTKINTVINTEKVMSENGIEYVKPITNDKKQDLSIQNRTKTLVKKIKQGGFNDGKNKY